MGIKMYPDAKKILIHADGAGVMEVAIVCGSVNCSHFAQTITLK